MSHHNHHTHESPFSPSSTGVGSHSGWWYPEQDRAILPRFIVAFQASDSPVVAQGSTHVPYELPIYPPSQQQQIHTPHLTSPSQQLSEARNHGSQTHGGFPNSALASPGSADLLWHFLHNPSHADLQIPSDLRSPYSMYSPASRFSLSQSTAIPTYSAGDSSSQGAGPTVAAANTHYQQSMAMSLASLDTIPRSQGTGHLPYAQVSTSSSLVAYDVPPQAPKPTVKKKRKRPDARQLDALNTMYARTRYPPTAEREQLARDLNMGPRTVQVWFQNKRQADKRSGRNPSNSPISQVTHPSDTPPIVVHPHHLHGSSAPVTPMDESSYPSLSPLPAMPVLSFGPTPSTPSADIDPRSHWIGHSRGY